MPPRVTEQLRSVVSKFVRDVEQLRIGPIEQRFRALLPDIFHFREQTLGLAQYGLTPRVVIFNDDDDNGTRLPVLLQIPDLSNVAWSYEQALGAFEQSDLEIEEVEPAAARNIFIDRLAEFIVAASASAGAPTTVNSNRHGDTLLYAKGYFTSTGTAFGVSTPAVAQLSGRYSFGIVDNGKHRFDSVVWTCPNANVRVDLP